MFWGYGAAFIVRAPALILCLVSIFLLPPFDAVAAAAAPLRYPRDGDAVPYLRANLSDLEHARALAANNVAML